MSDVVTILLDCHAYPYHEANEECPEAGPENMIRLAEEYGIMITYLEDPREHLRRFLANEYGDPETADEILDSALA